MRKLLPVVGLSGLLWVLVSCTGSRVMTYGVDSATGANDNQDRTITLQVATLDSIRPFMKTFYTGTVYTEAPNLDPREFFSPDSLIEEAMDFSNDQMNVHLMTSPLVTRPYEILGEVAVDLGNNYRLIALEGSEGPHGKAWWVKKQMNSTRFNLPLKGKFEELTNRARESGADAVIEIFIGRGLETQYAAAQSYYVPGAANPATGMISPGYTISTPATVAVSNWKMYGLLVKWKDEQ